MREPWNNELALPTVKESLRARETYLELLMLSQSSKGPARTYVYICYFVWKCPFRFESASPPTRPHSTLALRVGCWSAEATSNPQSPPREHARTFFTQLRFYKSCRQDLEAPAPRERPPDPPRCSSRLPSLGGDLRGTWQDAEGAHRLVGLS